MDNNPIGPEVGDTQVKLQMKLSRKASKMKKVWKKPCDRADRLLSQSSTVGVTLQVHRLLSKQRKWWEGDHRRYTPKDLRLHLLVQATDWRVPTLEALLMTS